MNKHSKFRPELDARGFVKNLISNSVAILLLVIVAVSLSSTQAIAQFTVSSLADLRTLAATQDNATITLTPGDYWIDGDHIANPTSSEPIFLDLEGNNNTYNLTGANLKLDTRKLDGFGRALGHDSGIRVVRVGGSNNTINGLNLTGYDLELDTDPDAQRYADWAAVYVQLTGTDNTMNGTHVLTRGSSPYGLGDAFGKGARTFPQGEPADEGGYPWIGHNKTSAFNVFEANGAVIDDMHLDVKTYGHGFFVQVSDDTTLTNSTVVGELFPSTNVSTHEKYIEYGGITKDGNPIPEDIFISGAEDGVRMYTGASNLTVDNVVVTNMRSGFAVALGSGDISLNNVESYGAEHAFDFRSNTTITNAKGDIVNGPLIWHPYENSANSSIEIELVGDAPEGHDWAAAFVSGNNVDVTINSDLPAGALGDDALIRFGQRWWNDWRDHDNLDSFDQDAFDYINSSFTNNTNQTIWLGNDVTGNTGSSQAPVVTNGKDNAYDGISLVPAGQHTVVSHSNGLGNNGTSEDGTLETNASIVELGGMLELAPGIEIDNEKLTISGNGIDNLGALYSDGETGSGTRFGSSSGSNESTIFLDGNASIGVGIAGNQLLIGSLQGTGNFTKRGEGKLAIEKASTFDGSFTVAEGEVVSRSNVVLGNLTVNAGASFAGIGSNAINTSDTVFIYGTVDINARTDTNGLTAKMGTLFGSGNIGASNTSATTSSELTLDVDAFGYFLGSIEDNISLIKEGPGTQVLASNSTYSGTTTINEGVLQIEGTHTGGDDYFVNDGGTLGGFGTINAPVTINSGGVLAPGASAGLLTVNAAEFLSGSTLEIEIGGTTAGTEFDQLSAADLALGGTLEVSFLNAFTPNSSDVFTIVTSSTLIGTFENVADGERIQTADGEGSFLVTYNSSTNTVELSSYLLDSGLLEGDFNLDGIVDAADYSVWRDSFGTTGLTPYDGADADGDGSITQADYYLWVANYGATSSSIASTSVPEPTTLLLLSLVFPMLSTRSIRN